MTQITDVPQSGIYFQAGAIVQIVAQIIDVNTGLPVQLGTATGLAISILYPSRSASQTFAAQLLTDGSDGMIVYTTVNNGTTIDLSQVGLYQMQGVASIGGSQSILSYETDFYVLPNVFGNPTPPPSFEASAMIFFDTAGIRWALTINGSGVQTIALQPSGPTSFLYFGALVMQDPAGIYWTASLSTTGDLTWTEGGTYADALTSFVLMDTSGRSWVLTITEGPNPQLVAA